MPTIIEYVLGFKDKRHNKREGKHNLRYLTMRYQCENCFLWRSPDRNKPIGKI